MAYKPTEDWATYYRERAAEARAKGETMHSDVPSQALRARLIALLLPFWLEGVSDRSCRGEGGT
jgi:hypothetical protein